MNYSTFDYSTFTSSSYTEDDSECEDDDNDNYLFDNISNTVVEVNFEIMLVDWEKPIVVRGEAGCGKSYIIRSIVTYLVREEANVLVTAPTGLLAAVFKASLPDEVQCDIIVHASFHYPVESDHSPSINWHLSNYDVIIIDEISMISDVIFQHILKTLNALLLRPILLLSGDAGQQQPFSHSNGKIMQIESLFDNSAFINSVYNYRLLVEHRVGDDAYFEFFNTIRKWVAAQQYLDQMQEGRVIACDVFVTDDVIMEAFALHADTTILTFTNNAANRVNRIIITKLIHQQNPVACLQLDCDLPAINIYNGMRVVITQNRDKANGVVNGQIATVHTIHNLSVYLKLMNHKIVAIYPVTMNKNGQRTTLYPFCPAYATTLCKAQGQTLQKLVVWFDTDNIPPGTAYVALSRVRCRNDIYFMTQLKPYFFTPVTRLAELL